MSIDKHTIINWTLTDIGVGPIFSSDDGSDLSEVCENAWQRTVDQLLGMHDWSFARKTFKNRRRDEEPENGWRFAFDLPGVRIGNPLKVMDQAGADPRPLRVFTIEEGILFCNVVETWSLVKCEVHPSAWPPEWRAAFVIAYGGYLAVPVWSDENMRDSRLQEAFGTPSREGTGGLFGRLMAQDKASNPVGEPMQNDNPVMAVRSQGAGAGLRDDHWAGRFA